jgi:beta-lactamase class A
MAILHGNSTLMLTKKVPLYFVLIAFAFPGMLFLLGFCYFNDKSSSELAAAEELLINYNECNNYNIKRLSGYQFIRPLLYAEPTCESNQLAQYKTDIQSLIEKNKNQGNITTASVYIREFLKAEWISINENEKYSPGSLLKIPELITFYKMNEDNPGVLNQKVLYAKPFVANKHATFLSKQIKLGETYTIRELLEYMIVYSDNNATLLLNSIINQKAFKRTFTDIGLSEPDFNASQYPITANDFSIFMKELFNASYLNKEDSEACLNLLSKSDFRDGMLSGLPESCATAHKFGEGGFDNAPNFSESAIVYCGKRPYLVTIMTKGTDMKKLPKVVGEISKKVYDIMNSRA